MGRASNRKKTRNLFDKHTPQEVHRQLAFPSDAKCGGCASTKVAVRCRTFAPLKWFIEERPQLAMLISLKHNGRLPVVKFTHGPHVRVGDAFACDHCRGALEREAAKGPSFIVAHFDYGPGPEKSVVQVS